MVLLLGLDQRHAGDNSDSSPLFHCSRSDYGVVASLDNSFSSLIRRGELYRLQRQNGVVEHWVYSSFQLLEWDVFDPSHHRWMHLPTMNASECFRLSYKEFVVVGIELLVFGKGILSPVIYRYSLLTNTWSYGTQMIAPRCLFGSASLGEIAILAGGCDSQGNILNLAERYNSEAGTWENLSSMNKQRQMCFGVFMGGKFYVMGGIGGDESKWLTCVEEYDLETETWSVIPNMSPNANRNDMRATSGAPPLVAVVNNELYVADYADMDLRKYDKKNNIWITVGQLPERAISINGNGLGFRACGDRLIVIVGHETADAEYVEVNSWIPSEGALQWNLLGLK